MNKPKLITIIGLFILLIIVSGCTYPSTSQVTVGNSTFQLTSDWHYILNRNNTNDTRIIINSGEKNIIVQQYPDINSYQINSENNNLTTTINGTICKCSYIPPAAIWFEKNNKYYSINYIPNKHDGSPKNGTQARPYFEEIISTLK
ncbi:hypothetical protein [Methanobacterium alcaliphilum]|uniref:hypothetical protein n=1 Tax=Methanobacterium alcaliphilum TaxID=392018 RepID=UPI00200B8153|nr:hypothetical protein [Methanobacterium alcaliphilum]MCK9151061.1 hypothetical protein [Methanobacterium alcaliphilum]